MKWNFPRENLRATIVALYLEPKGFSFQFIPLGWRTKPLQDENYDWGKGAKVHSQFLGWPTYCYIVWGGKGATYWGIDSPPEIPGTAMANGLNILLNVLHFDGEDGLREWGTGVSLNLDRSHVLLGIPAQIHALCVSTWESSCALLRSMLCHSCFIRVYTLLISHYCNISGNLDFMMFWELNLLTILLFKSSIPNGFYKFGAFFDKNGVFWRKSPTVL